MAFNPTRIVLNACDQELPVISYNVSFHQGYNPTTGNVTGEPIGGLLEISVVSDADSSFLEWMKDVNEEPEDGSIEFYSGNQLEKSIDFNEAHLVGYNQNLDEVVDAAGVRQRVISEDLTIIWKTMDIWEVEFERLTEES